MVPVVIEHRTPDAATFRCHHCGNNCRITRRTRDDRVELLGAVCGRWEDERVDPEAPLPGENAWAHGARLVLHHAGVSSEPVEPSTALGIPRAANAPELLPLWTALARAMGREPLLAPASSWDTVARGRERLPELECPPLQVAAGQILELVDRGVEHLLLPQLDEEATRHLESLTEATVLAPEVRMSGGPATALVVRESAEDLDLSTSELAVAVQEGIVASHRLRRDLQAIGREVLESDADRVVVVIGRSSILEPLLHAGLVTGLDRSGLPSLPMECLPLDTVDPAVESGSFCSTHCLDQARAAALCAADSRLVPVFASSAGCRSDDEMSAHMRQLLAGRPRLVLDVDSARSPVALANRVEAFTAALRS